MINFTMWLIIGGLSGWLAGLVLRMKLGVWLSIVVGIVGAFLGGFISSALGLDGSTINSSNFSLTSLISSVVGAIVLLGTIKLFMRGTQKLGAGNSPADHRSEVQTPMRSMPQAKQSAPETQPAASAVQAPAREPDLLDSLDLQSWRQAEQEATAVAQPAHEQPQPAPAPRAKPAPPQPQPIFISYRREDSADAAGRIYDRLVQRFGKDAVFKDVDSIPLGVNFQQHLVAMIEQCTLLLAVIGRQWLVIEDRAGQQRLANPRDFVRIELEAALQRDMPIIPLLVQGATMPPPEQLPEPLRELSYRNGVAIRPDPDFHRDMDRLIQAVERYLEQQR